MDSVVGELYVMPSYLQREDAHGLLRPALQVTQ